MAWPRSSSAGAATAIGDKTTRLYHAAASDTLPAEHNCVDFETQEEASTVSLESAENEGLGSAGP